MKRIEPKKVASRKRQIARLEIKRRQRRVAQRLAQSSSSDRGRPMTNSGNVHYEYSARCQGTGLGGMAAVHRFVKRIGLDVAINERLQVFKRRCPYYESDHVLNLAYNSMCGSSTLQDIESRRNDEHYLDSLGAERIPDPTTAGDFCRRMSSPDIDALQEAIDAVRVKIWASQCKQFKQLATIDMDATIVETTGRCKGGMDLSYKNIWGYHPLVFSLAETGEILRITNRSGNAQSGHNAFKDVDQVIGLCQKSGFQRIMLRGDTAFTQTDHLDRWDKEGVEFVFGIAAHKNLVEIADDIQESNWKPVPRKPRYDDSLASRARPTRVKDQIIDQRGYKNRKMKSEHYVEVEYKPYKCKQTYRLIIVRKILNVTEQGRLFEDYRYFFYLSNLPCQSYLSTDVIYESNKRCNQENVLAQLGAARALHAPVDELVSNWAYMVMASLSWTLKAWIALSIPESTDYEKKNVKDDRKRLLAMEHRTFVEQFIRLPALIVRTGRRLIVRLLGVNQSSESFNRFLQVALE